METLIEDLKKVMNSEIENKEKYMKMLINGFLREKQTEQLPIHVVSQSFYCWEKEALNQKCESVCDVCRGSKLEAN